MSIMPNITRIPIISNFTHLSMIQVSNAIMQLLLFPIIIRVVGMEAFGKVSVAFAYASTMGILVNYGTSLSTIKDIASATNHHQRSFVYTETLLLRIVVVIIPCICLFLTPLLQNDYTVLFLFATPVILAEVLNPLSFYTGLEKILPYNIANLAAKLLSAAGILLWVQKPDDAYLVNCIFGMASICCFVFLHLHLHQHWQIRWTHVQKDRVFALLKQNFPLTGNNLTVQLQQSLFLFFLSGYSNPIILGAYAVCDKIVWSFRLFIIAFCGAIFPTAIRTFQDSPAKAMHQKRQINLLFTVVFGIAGIILIAWPQLAVWLFTGEQDSTTILYVRSVGFVPLLAALNALNVIELLIKNQYKQLFQIGLIVLGATLIVSWWIAASGLSDFFGYYLLFTETIALIAYLIFLRKKTYK